MHETDHTTYAWPHDSGFVEPVLRPRRSGRNVLEISWELATRPQTTISTTCSQREPGNSVGPPLIATRIPIHGYRTPQGVATAHGSFPSEQRPSIYFGQNVDATGLDDGVWIEPGVAHPEQAAEYGQVRDRTSPYRGDWYVTAQHLRVERVMQVNSALLPGGAIANLNQNEPQADALSQVTAEVADHEHEHDVLAFQALRNQKGVDPAERAGQAVTDSLATIQAETTLAMSHADIALGNVSTDAKVHSAPAAKWGGRSATILIPPPGDDHGSESYLIPDLAGLGDPTYCASEQ